MDDIEYSGLSRADYKFLRLAAETDGITSDVHHADVPEYVDALIRMLAGKHSQIAIANTLNERGIFRPNGKEWEQYHLSRYFKANGIKGAHKWRGTQSQLMA